LIIAIRLQRHVVNLFSIPRAASNRTPCSRGLTTPIRGTNSDSSE
jgi:hypothetical protein